MFDFFGHKEKFLTEYWRKKPLVIRDGIGTFTPQRVSTEEFIEASRLAQPKRWLNVKEISKDNPVIFAENISSYIPKLAKQAEVMATQLNVLQKTWFDGSYSIKGHGIGRHFDDSDNFVIQQEGVRLWILGNREFVTDEQRKRRSRHEPDAGGLPPFKEMTFVILEPGDVLYLPIFYPHWGITLEKSLSITYAVQSGSTVKYLFSTIMKILQDKEGWWQPFPSHVEDLMSEEYKTLLAKTFSNKEFIDEVLNSFCASNQLETINAKESILYSSVPIKEEKWNPNEGIEEWNINSKPTISIVKEDLIRILEDANEQTLDDFRDLIKEGVN